ncbi:MAG TPA: superinfection immunity protein [Gaiellaceae bacterium]|nr:superinfection immunity protein [Gaiellaceae bacterium]
MVVGSSAGLGAAGFFVLIMALGLYFLPTIIGAVRHVPNMGSVIVVNLFLGWTFVGWVIALAMAARSVPARQ